MENIDVIEELWTVIQDRKSNPKGGSYTNELLTDEDMIFCKLNEELAEVIKAAKEENLGPGKDSLIWESSDLLYHLLVLLVAKGVELDDVFKELKKRR